MHYCKLLSLILDMRWNMPQKNLKLNADFFKERGKEFNVCFIRIGMVKNAVFEILVASETKKVGDDKGKVKIAASNNEGVTKYAANELKNEGEGFEEAVGDRDKRFTFKLASHEFNKKEEKRFC